MHDRSRLEISLPTTTLDVFALAAMQGNHHIVLHDADALESETMAAHARRTRLSETSFVQAPTVDAADYRHRIFTVAGELPFAGHPSLGTAAAVTLRSGAREASLVQQTLAGLQQLFVKLGTDRSFAHVDLVQNVPQFLERPDPGALLRAVGLAVSDAHPHRGAEVISTGLPTVVLPVAGEDVLRQALPDAAALARALGDLRTDGVVTLYLVAMTEEAAADEPSRWRARCFSPQVAGSEDAATGSAAGPLAAYSSHQLSGGAVEITQGVEMGCPSFLSASCDGDRVVVSGSVQILGTGTIRLPTGPGEAKGS